MGGLVDDRMRLFPVEIQLALRCCAVAQIQVDEALVRDADFLRDRLEVLDGFIIQPDGDLLLELRRVRVLACFGEVVFLAHGRHLVSSPWIPWEAPFARK